MHERRRTDRNSPSRKAGLLKCDRIIAYLFSLILTINVDIFVQLVQLAVQFKG